MLWQLQPSAMHATPSLAKALTGVHREIAHLMRDVRYVNRFRSMSFTKLNSQSDALITPR